jgi:hypothetical protein
MYACHRNSESKQQFLYRGAGRIPALALFLTQSLTQSLSPTRSMSNSYKRQRRLFCFRLNSCQFNSTRSFFTTGQPEKSAPHAALDLSFGLGCFVLHWKVVVCRSIDSPWPHHKQYDTGYLASKLATIASQQRLGFQ